MEVKHNSGCKDLLSNSFASVKRCFPSNHWIKFSKNRRAPVLCKRSLASSGHSVLCQKGNYGQLGQNERKATQPDLQTVHLQQSVLMLLLQKKNQNMNNGRQMEVLNIRMSSLRARFLIWLVSVICISVSIETSYFIFENIFKCHFFKKNNPQIKI